MTTTIENDFLQPVDIKAGYEAFFAGLMEIVGEYKMDNLFGEALREYVQQFLVNCNWKDFCDFSDTLYKRVYLGKDVESGWEAIMMCWKKRNRTSVHGHPQFAAYYFASGRFLVEVFEEKPGGGVEFISAFETGGGEGFFAVGSAGTFNNHIHRITCLSDTGHSLHVYSDDARKGEKYLVESEKLTVESERAEF